MIQDHVEWIDEELPPPRRTLPGGPWPMRIAGVLLVMAAVVIVVVRGGSTQRPDAQPLPSPSNSPLVIVPPDIPGPLPIVPGRIVATLPPVPQCPAADDGQLACTTRHSVPAAFTAAVRHLLPGVRSWTAVTELLRSTGSQSVIGLWSRRFTAHAGGATIRIVVGHPLGGSLVPTSGFDDGRHVILLVERPVDIYTVAVQVAAPSGKAPSLDRIVRLAGDRRLTVV